MRNGKRLHNINGGLGNYDGAFGRKNADAWLGSGSPSHVRQIMIPELTAWVLST